MGGEVTPRSRGIQGIIGVMRITANTSEELCKKKHLIRTMKQVMKQDLGTQKREQREEDNQE